LRDNFPPPALIKRRRSLSIPPHSFTAFASLITDIAPKIWCLKASANLHIVMLRKILQSPMDFFDRTPVGRIISRFSKDIDVVDSLLPMFLCSCVYCGAMVNDLASSKPREDEIVTN
jgi:ABC-type multidrug transport system fused ATPase/permease subunit